jgi:hypothetical protein
MSATHQTEFDALETTSQDYSSLVRASYVRLFESLLAPETEPEAPGAFEQPS